MQEVRLHDAVVPGSEALANVTYQLSSFLYVLDHLLEARAICQRSIDLCSQLYPSGDDHVSSPVLGCCQSSQLPGVQLQTDVRPMRYPAV